MKKKEILDDIYWEVHELRKDVLDLKRQLNDITSWQIKTMIPVNTPPIPTKKENVCRESQVGQMQRSLSCSISNLEF